MQSLIVRVVVLTGWGWERTPAISACRSERHAIFPLKTHPISPLSVIISFSESKATAAVTSVYVHSRWLVMPERLEKRAHARSLSLSCSSFCQTFISYIDWTSLVPSTRKWRRAHIYIYIYVFVCVLSFNKYCTTIDLFLNYCIMDKLCWWTYMHRAQKSRELGQTSSSRVPRST